MDTRSSYANQQTLIVPIDVTNDVQSASILLFRGDVLEGFTVALERQELTQVNPSGVKFRAVAENGQTKVGPSRALPAASLELVPELLLPWTVATQAVDKFTVATGQTTVYGGFAAMKHEIPVYLRIDAVTREVCISVDTQTTPDHAKGYVAFKVSRSSPGEV